MIFRLSILAYLMGKLTRKLPSAENQEPCRQEYFFTGLQSKGLGMHVLANNSARPLNAALTFSNPSLACRPFATA
jgi:hypothetical protein